MIDDGHRRGATRSDAWHSAPHIHPWGTFEANAKNVAALESWYKLMETFDDSPYMHCQADRVLALLRAHVNADPGLSKRCRREEAQALSQLCDISEGSVFHRVKESYMPFGASIDPDWMLMSEKLARFRDAVLTSAQWALLEGALAPFTPVLRRESHITRRMIILHPEGLV